MGAGAEAAAGEWVNEVHLVGRVSSEPEERELPSGDVVVLFRLVVPRPAPGRKRPGAGKPAPSAGGATATAPPRATPATLASPASPATLASPASPVRVDTIDIACWARRARSSAARLRPGDHAEVSGALRRRFFRAGGAAASRYEVDATAVRRRYRPAAV